MYNYYGEGMKFSSKYLLICFFLLFSFSNVYASSGSLRKTTIKTCPDGITYGQHGSDSHWHVAKESETGYIASGDVLKKDPCPEIAVQSSTTTPVIVKLDRCVDGDTASFIIDGISTKVRMLAIDTPETVHPTQDVELYGKDASEYTCKSLTNAKEIIIEYDSGSTKKDKYNRDLVWVFVDGELLQETLVKIGYAEVKYIYGTYKYTERLYKVQEEAKNNKLGIWNENELSSNLNDNDISDDSENKDKNDKLVSEDIWYIIIIIIIVVIGYFVKHRKVK